MILYDRRILLYPLHVVLRTSNRIIYLIIIWQVEISVVLNEKKKNRFFLIALVINFFLQRGNSFLLEIQRNYAFTGKPILHPITKSPDLNLNFYNLINLIKTWIS